MTDNEYIELREYIIEQLNINGFGDIVIEVNTRLKEDYADERFQKTPLSFLIYFLKESIDILDSLSNQKFDELLSRFNNISGNKTVKTIYVELMNQGESVIYDLKELPNYKEITTTFQEILQEIQKHD